MPGNAVLDPNNLVDGLVEDVIDGLREELHPQFGVRPYRVFLVTRTWTGRTVGDGRVTESEEEIRPQPDVVLGQVQSEEVSYRLEQAGIDEVGGLVLQEVSLTYTDEQLTGGDLKPNQQFFYRLDEAQGQGQPSRWFVLGKPPVVDRAKTMGWIVYLRRTSP